MKKPSTHSSVLNRIIKVGARGSKLSQSQVWEIQRELSAFYPEIELFPTWITTGGDKDLLTSLRDLEKSDFFTREVDQLLLEGVFQVAIHSAKDLPDPLPAGLELIALTRGVSSADVIVYNTYPLPYGAKVGTSSLRREHNLTQWRPDLQCVDIRGTIEGRLQLLDSGKLDGLIIAEAALIRLGLTHRTYQQLPGEIAPFQGQLAIVARQEDLEMRMLFSIIDVRAIK